MHQSTEAGTVDRVRTAPSSPDCCATAIASRRARSDVSGWLGKWAEACAILTIDTVAHRLMSEPSRLGSAAAVFGLALVALLTASVLHRSTDGSTDVSCATYLNLTPTAA